MNMLKISKAIFRSLLSFRSLCVVVVALMVLCALPVFRSAAGIDGRVEYLESGITVLSRNCQHPMRMRL